MLGVDKLGEIWRAHYRDGRLIRGISRDLGVSRVTTRKVLRSDATAFFLNCTGFSGEQSAKQASRKLKGGDPCQRESTARGNRPNSAYAEFGCSRKIVPTTPATARPKSQSPRSSDAPVSRFANGASRRSATPGSGWAAAAPTRPRSRS